MISYKTVKSRSLFRSSRILGTLLLVPALLFIVFAVILPIGWNFALSLTDWNGFSKVEIVGFDNYLKFLKDTSTLKGFIISIIIALGSSTIALTVGLFLALMINIIGRKTGSAFRLIFFAPSMMPMIVIGLMFTFILTPDIGLINIFLRAIGLGSLGKAWLGDPKLVLWTLSVVSGWRGSGSVMMLMYTSIVGIPTSMFEAAKLEGASYFQQIRRIILPLIMPTIRLVAMLVLIGSFKTYDIITVMTKGGPGDYSMTVPLHMLKQAFLFNQFGYASTIGVIFTLLVSVIIFLFNKFAKGDVHEY